MLVSIGGRGLEGKIKESSKMTRRKLEISEIFVEVFES